MYVGRNEVLEFLNLRRRQGSKRRRICDYECKLYFDSMKRPHGSPVVQFRNKIISRVDVETLA